MAANKRTYEGTHPWIKFRVDLERASPELWMLLGEARSKCDHLAGVPLRPSTQQEMLKVYLAKGVLATAAIEGNTLSEDQVNQIIDKKLDLPKSQKYLETEINNIITAVNQIAETRLHSADGSKFSLENLRKYNALILKNLKVGEHVVPGSIRTYSVGVARYRGAPFEDCEYLLNRMCEWLNEPEFEPNDRYGIAPAIIRAILAHLYLAWIHPFGDGNGRTARLLEVETLLSAGVPTVAAHLLSNHYNETRQEYYRQLEQASISGGDVIPFLMYAVQGFVDQLAKQIKRIREEQLDIVWRNYVYEQFQQPNATRIRQRHLVLDMSITQRAYTRQELLEVSPRIASAYAGKTLKTLSRDLHELLKRKLVIRTGTQYQANVMQMQAFIPSRRPRVGDSANKNRVPVASSPQ